MIRHVKTGQTADDRDDVSTMTEDDRADQRQATTEDDRRVDQDVPTSGDHRDDGALGPLDDTGKTDGHGKERRKQRLSERLTEIALDETRERLSVADLLAALQGRAIAALLLIFAFPNALPSPPGMSGILGLPLVYLSFQMMLGRKPWLPRFISDRSMSRADFSSIINRSTPFLARAEKLLAPRLQQLSNPVGARVVGTVCLILSIILFLPIPFGNMLPAIGICMMALGMLERDGVWILAGFAVAILSLVVVSGVIWAFIIAIGMLLS